MPLAPDQIIAGAAYAEALADLRRQRPAAFYHPHDRGQIQFHRSRHVLRAMFPGNGWGKTRAVGTEAMWWIEHTHPYQPTPSWPIHAIWFCQEFRQFDLLRTDLERDCLSRGYTWNEQKHSYRWPGGDTLWVASCDRSWTHLQGINPDLIIFDEQPPLALYREMLQRRRGRKKTRYVIAATATEGESWMEGEIYLPWKQHHEGAGLNMDMAREQQTHDWYWVWDQGGIDDNPGADAGDRRWYHSRTWSSLEEKRVRLFGGFGTYNGMPVFDREALELLGAGLLQGRVCGIEVKAA